jgi:hypothetical protein
VDGRECRIGNPGIGWGGGGGRWLALSVGVFGTLVMHSPKVPHPDFSVQVVRHNLKIFAVENFGRRLRRSLDGGRSVPSLEKAPRLGQPVRGATRGGKRWPTRRHNGKIYIWGKFLLRARSGVRHVCPNIPVIIMEHECPASKITKAGATGSSRYTRQQNWASPRQIVGKRLTYKELMART